MKARLKATVTITEEYDADSRDYGGAETAKEMIEIDKENFEGDMWAFIESMLDGGGQVTIKISRVKKWEVTECQK